MFGAIESDDWLAVQGRAGAGNEDVSKDKTRQESLLRIFGPHRSTYRHGISVTNIR